MAIELSDLGLTLSDFRTPVGYAYVGVAVSNPSAVNGDVFVNDHFPAAIGPGSNTTRSD